jgi:hypothetical protein
MCVAFPFKAQLLKTSRTLMYGLASLLFSCSFVHGSMRLTYRICFVGFAHPKKKARRSNFQKTSTATGDDLELSLLFSYLWHISQNSDLVNHVREFVRRTCMLPLGLAALEKATRCIHSHASFCLARRFIKTHLHVCGVSKKMDDTT